MALQVPQRQHGPASPEAMTHDHNANMEDYSERGHNLTAPLNSSLSAVSSILQEPAGDDHYLLGLVLSCLYTVLLFPLGFVGNILILVVNLGHGGALSAPDLYFVNLAAADLMLVCDSLIEVFNLKRGYYENAALCTFMALFQQVNMYSSVFFLTWMSFDRCKVLTGAAARRPPAAQARLSCCLVWVASGLLTVLPFALAHAQHRGELHFCFANVSQVLWLEVTLGFLLPFCVLGVCYGRIALRLLRSRRGPSGPQQWPRRLRALRMISAAVLVFFLCWLPENVFVCVHLLRGPAGGRGSVWQDYPLAAHVVRLAAFSNSCLNPLIYSFLGETFRDRLRLFLKQRRASGHQSPHRPALAPGPQLQSPHRPALAPGPQLQRSNQLSKIIIYPHKTLKDPPEG